VSATVTSSGGSPAIRVAYRSNLETPLSALLVGVPHLATEFYQNVTGGSPYGPICCPMLRSVSNSSGFPVSTPLEATPGGVTTSTLVFGSLSASPYSVELYVSSPDMSRMLSPVSSVFLDATNSSHPCGGEEAAGATFYDQDNGEVYVANDGTDSISVLNASSDLLLTTISLPMRDSMVYFELYDPGNRDLYVTGQDQPLPTFVIDTGTNFLVANITLPGDQSLTNLVYDPGSGDVFAVDNAPSLIVVIDGATNKLIANISGINTPSIAAYDAKNGDLYAQTAINGTTYVIDGNTYRIVGSLATPSLSGITDSIYDPDNGVFYFANSVTKEILLINATSNLLMPGTIPLNSSGILLFYDSFNKELYFYNGPSFPPTTVGGELMAYSTVSGARVAQIPVPGVNGGLEYETPSFLLDSLNGDIYATEVANSQNGTVGLLHISESSNRVVSQTFPARMPLNDVSLDPIDNEIFAGNGLSVYVLDANSGVVTTVGLGSCIYSSLPP
jgi:DNA-binding beta-propeller fold protein YncE